MTQPVVDRRAMWNNAAKYRQQHLGRIPYDGGLNQPQLINLRNAGYLERIQLYHQLSGQYSSAGPSAVDPFGTYCGAINRITLRVNSIGELFDVSGFGASIVSFLENQYRYGSGSLTPTPPYAFTTSPSTNAFVDGWALTVPVAGYFANLPYPLGLIQAALNSMLVTLECRFNPVAVANQSGNSLPVPGSGVYGGNAGNLLPAATITGSYVDVRQDYFDPIADPNAQPPLGMIHRWREVQYPISADGDTEIRLNPSNVYTRAVVYYVQGAANTLALNGWVSPASPGAITRFQLKYGGNFAPFDYTAAEIMALQSARYAATIPAGVYILDQLEDTHTERDGIDSAATTDLRLVITTSGGSYAGGAYLRVITEEYIRLDSLPGGAALVQGMVA